MPTNSNVYQIWCVENNIQCWIRCFSLYLRFSLEIVLLSNFFWNLAWLIFMIWTLKKCNKKMGSPCLFTRQRALKMGYFYWLRVKNSSHLHTELSLGYPKDTKFYLERKASFIDISIIASCKLFLVARLQEYCTFLDSSLVSLKSWPWPKYIQ